MIQKTFEQALKSLPNLILRKVLVRKIKEAGIEIPDEAVDAFTEHIISGNKDGFVWDRENQTEFKSYQIELTEEDLQEVENRANEVFAILPDVIKDAVRAVSDNVFMMLRKRWGEEYVTQLFVLENFRNGIEEHWGEGLDYLRMLLTCCREFGEEILARHIKSNSKRNHYRRWVMSRLHVRSCQVADEIICLLENGFADGAMARWRTLYEISVVATLIADGDEDLAERYILHDAVETKRQADEYDATQVPLGFAPIGKRQRANIEQAYKAVVERFGGTFSQPYGWIAKHLNHKKPTFKDLQEQADRAGLSSHYKMASFNVHAGARRLFFNLGCMGDETIHAAGRTNAGLLEPGERTAHTLLLVTSLYAGNISDINQVTKIDVLIRIRNLIGPALQIADRRLQREERAKLKQIQMKENRARRQSKLATAAKDG